MNSAITRKTQEALEKAQYYINREFLTDLENPANQALKPMDVPLSAIRMIRFDKIVYNNEDIHSRIVTLYRIMAELSDVCFLYICGHKNETDLYLGIRSGDRAAAALSALSAGITGNFPGTSFREMDGNACAAALSRVRNNCGERTAAVVSVAQVPDRRKDSQTRDEEGYLPDAQGLEHFIDAMKGKTYTAMIMARPLGCQEIMARRNLLENMYTSLSALEKITVQTGENATRSQQETISESITDSLSQSVSDSFTHTTMQNSGRNHGVSTQLGILGMGWGSNNGNFSSVGTQNANTAQKGTTNQTARQNGTAVMTGTTTGQSMSKSITLTNKAAADLLEQLDRQLERLRESEAYGLWESCAYFSAPTAETACVAANVYKSLSCGENSSSERSLTNAWVEHGDRERTNRDNILSALERGVIPTFRLSFGQICTFSSLVNGSELPVLMSLPRRSVPGVTVRQMASFGREVHLAEGTHEGNRLIGFGSTYHMGSVDPDSMIALNIDALCAHAIIAGASGVGKSTLISMLLGGLVSVGTKIMVVEPVKGEYKNLLGKIPGIRIYSTSPLKNRMLRINPFAFSDGVHVLTHIDRLIEVFSVCWPLYAAQPALLREAIEEAYLRAGWDLANSVYVRPGRVKYPDFRLLLSVIPGIIEKSRFVGESKGTYEGALLTRVAMLTHGTYGQVFNSSAPLDDRELFENNTIIDLSDVGSPETIALLMGILIIRLREYRQASGSPGNHSLRHVMVLEEAHNIIRAGNHANAEGGESVSQKSVEMLSRCIAEMRSYGQGFFISDQSPSEVDISCIRNTATKIIMRLPEAGDQRAMAESLSLTPEQTAELSRLPGRTALVYQSDWLEPVLVRINQDKRRYFTDKTEQVTYRSICALRGICVKQILRMAEQGRFSAAELSDQIRSVPGINGAKLSDFQALFRSYASDCAEKRLASDVEYRITFFAGLLTEILACDDIFRLVPLPEPDEACTAPLGRDERFRRMCRDWLPDAMEALGNYVHGITENEAAALLRYILLNDSRNKRQISVHNALYGTIKT